MGSTVFAPKPTLIVEARTAGSGGKRALPICIAAAAGSTPERTFARGVRDVELGEYGVVISIAA
jgi:hypothetical protein